ncbi:MAG: transketolase C-terminal domain-containing protein [Armatimonadota bacterium]
MKREGGDVTVVSWQKTLTFALEAADRLAKEGVHVQVVDPRTLLPLDIDTILESVANTGRLVVAHEAHAFAGFGAEIAAQVCERALRELKAPPKRVGAKFVPLPYSRPMESHVLPQTDDIVQAVRDVLG